MSSWDDDDALAAIIRRVEAERLDGGWWTRGPDPRPTATTLAPDVIATAHDDTPAMTARRRAAMAADFKAVPTRPPTANPSAHRARSRRHLSVAS